MVVALGGGAFVPQAIQEFLTENGDHNLAGLPVRASVGAHPRLSHRPLARDPEKFKKLYQDRRARLTERPNIASKSESDDPAPVVAAILKLPVF